MSFSPDLIDLPWDQNVETGTGLPGSTWSGTIFTWSDAVSIEIVLAHGATDPRFTDWFQRWQNTEKKETERFITLLTEIKGEEYFNERKKDNKKIVLTVEDINILADNMRAAGIQLNVDNIKLD